MLPLAGEWTFDSFSRHLGELDTFPAGAPEMPVYRSYRRWAFESAALDLALRQAGRSLAEAVGREPRPVTFVVSSRMGEPPTIAPVDAPARPLPRPALQARRDAATGTTQLIAALVETGAVDSIDFKGAYKGTAVDVADRPGPLPPHRRGVPRRVAGGPRPRRRRRRAPRSRPYEDRITWDAPIHSIDDILARRVLPRTVNLKPSRFGSVSALFDAYDFCAERGMGAYGGGQYELGPGRGQIQYLAALFHPDAPNDIAPAGYDDARPRARACPPSPLEPELEPPASAGGHRLHAHASEAATDPSRVQVGHGGHAEARVALRRGAGGGDPLPRRRPRRCSGRAPRSAWTPSARASTSAQAIAAARPQERLQLRRMAEASLALAERRAGDLKVAAEKLGQTPPTNRQLLLLRFMGLIAPPPGSPIWRARAGILIVLLLIVAALALGWGIVQLIALPFGGLDPTISVFWGFCLVLRRARRDRARGPPPPGPGARARRPSSAPRRSARGRARRGAAAGRQ